MNWCYETERNEQHKFDRVNRFYKNILDGRDEMIEALRVKLEMAELEIGALQRDLMQCRANLLQLYTERRQDEH